MNGVLIAFGLVLMIPLFVGTWRMSLFGLSCQGFLMAWIAFRHGIHFSAGAALELVDLVLIRAIGAPLALYRVLRQQHAPRTQEVIAPNLLSWTLALALVLMAFRLADVLVPAEGEQQMAVAISASALLLGLLVLSTRRGPFSQMVGALRIENSIALFELGGGAHRESLGIRIGGIVIMAFSIALYRFYLIHLTAEESKETALRARESAAL